MALIGGVAAIAALVYVGAKGDPERQAEDDARDFYTRHGHWPDEPPSGSGGR